MNIYPKTLLAGFLMLGFSRGLAAPANDLFQNRTLLSGTNVVAQGDNTGAGTEPGEDTGSGIWFNSVWYSWTAPANGIAYCACSPNSLTVSNLVTRVVRGVAVDALTPVAATAGGGIPVASGDTLVIEIASEYFPAAGPFTLTLRLQVPEPNDAFAARLEIAAPAAQLSGSIGGATVEPNEPLPDAAVQQTLWWRFVPPANGVLNLTLSAVQFTPWLTVYNGATFAAMTSVPPANGSFYSVQAGREYSIQVGSGYPATGQFTLNAHYYTTTNDLFANRTEMIGTNLTYEGYFAAATLEPGECQPPATNTVWLLWVAPVTGRATYSLAAAQKAQYCNAYTGTTLQSLQAVSTVVAPNGDKSFLANAGTEYLFQISGGADTFLFTLAEIPLSSCPNDNFADALIVKGETISCDPASVIGATMELGEPAHMGSIPQKSIWWEWRAPVWGALSLSTQGSTVSNVVLAAYTGNAVEALTLVAKATNGLTFFANGGQLYHIAGVVDTNAAGDVFLSGQLTASAAATHPIPGNLLQEPSWEGTYIFSAQYWHWSGDFGGYSEAHGDCDGTTWPVLGPGTKVWQDVPTVPGHTYGIRFAYLIGGFLSLGSGDAHVRVSWDSNELGISGIPEAESGFWHWDDYTGVASNTLSRLTFENLDRSLEMDAFSVLDLSSPPTVVTQPASASTVSGGTVAFIVGAVGAQPMSYQWFFDDAPLAGKTQHQLVLNSVSTNQTGNYFVTITNAFGAITSAVASLFVDAPPYPTIVWQPYGDTVAVGSYYSFNVAAVGKLPLNYQWFLNGAALADATNRTLLLTNVTLQDAGTYNVSVNNSAGIVWSLPAALIVTTTNQGGGTVDFQNQNVASVTNQAPVFDVDGMTRLSGDGYLAQLYAGPSLEWLRPAGQPVSFQIGLDAGFVNEQFVTLANVAPYGEMVAQVRAWDAAFGSSYEEARALGGRFGKSEIISLRAGGSTPELGPTLLYGLQSFNLQSGLPRFTSGVLQMAGRQPQGVVVWSVTGEPGYRYLVEKAGHDFVFRPYLILTNVTGTVTFTDSAKSGDAVTLYRARILD